MKTAIISSVLLILLGATGAEVSGQLGAPGAERFVLTGMVVWSSSEGVAWLQEPDLTRNKPVTIRIGESVGPWKLTRFLDNGVELDGPAGKVLVPLQNAGGGGTAVAAGPAPEAASRTFSPNNSSRAATPPSSASVAPGPDADVNRPAPNAGGFGEALNRARAERAQRQFGNAQEQQPREVGPVAGQTARGLSPRSGPTSSDGGTAAGQDGTNRVIQLPVGGGKAGFRELFGHR